MRFATPTPPLSLRDVSGYSFALVVCVLLLGVLGWMLRSQRLREKYTVIWFGVIGGLVVLGFVPSITTWLTRVTGVTTPINLVFILAFLVLLVVSIQLSMEISRLEETARTVVEEVALLRLDLEQHVAGQHVAEPRVAGQQVRGAGRDDEGADGPGSEVPEVVGPQPPETFPEAARDPEVGGYPGRGSGRAGHPPG